jgi:hypothetical protein
MVRLSIKHSHQTKVSLFLNIICWVAGLYILGLFKVGPTPIYWKRISLMAKAVYAGYYPHSRIAKKMEASFFA